MKLEINELLEMASADYSNDPAFIEQSHGHEALHKLLVGRHIAHLSLLAYGGDEREVHAARADDAVTAFANYYHIEDQRL